MFKVDKKSKKISKNVKMSISYKIYEKGISLSKEISIEEDSFPVINSGLKDKNEKDIYIYDILTCGRGKFYICIFNNTKGKIDFLLYDKEEVQDFIWVDDHLNSILSVVCNGIEILQKKGNITRIPKKKILSIINGTNCYFLNELNTLFDW